MITKKKASQLVSVNKICTDSCEISGFFTPFLYLWVRLSFLVNFCHFLSLSHIVKDSSKKMRPLASVVCKIKFRFRFITCLCIIS